MTKKDLFRIIIKLFGLYAVISFITNNLSQLFMLSHFTEDDKIIYIWIVLAIVIFGAFAYLLIFYPDIIVRLFKLDKGLDDNEIKAETPDMERIITLAIIIVGGIFIAYSFSPLLVSIGNLITDVVNTRGLAEAGHNIEKERLYINIFNLIIGYLLITNHRKVTRFLLSVNKKKETNDII
ncbi:hypothetical protein LJC00_01310 [Dysgonomonas sp. OttesenSCG-928-M03]|nr:hypothetical protein [Dysgonomonas sp. OttesenSCG-928-M03]